MTPKQEIKEKANQQMIDIQVDETTGEVIEPVEEQAKTLPFDELDD